MIGAQTIISTWILLKSLVALVVMIILSYIILYFFIRTSPEEFYDAPLIELAKIKRKKRLLGLLYILILILFFLQIILNKTMYLLIFIMLLFASLISLFYSLSVNRDNKVDREVAKGRTSTTLRRADSYKTKKSFAEMIKSLNLYNLLHNLKYKFLLDILLLITIAVMVIILRMVRPA